MGISAVKCNADVEDTGTVDIFSGRRMWRVHVWGVDGSEGDRVYQIPGKNDTVAALEGMRRFVAEMEAHPVPR